MAWCFEDEATDATDAILDRLRDEVASVPVTWSLEVVNVLLVAERRARVTEADASRFLELLAQLPIEIDAAPTRMAEIVAAGRRHALSSCDASYLVLAERLGVPLATVDQRLADAASNAGVALLIRL